jgi:hypothetical protein
MLRSGATGGNTNERNEKLKVAKNAMLFKSSQDLPLLWQFNILIYCSSS